MVKYTHLNYFSICPKLEGAYFPMTSMTAKNLNKSEIFLTVDKKLSVCMK